MYRHIGRSIGSCGKGFALLVATAGLVLGMSAVFGQDDFWETAARTAGADDTPAEVAAPAPEADPAGGQPVDEAVVDEDDVNFRGIEMQPEELTAFEAVRRQEMYLRAEYELAQGRKAHVEGEFQQAIDMYQAARTHFLQSGNTPEILRQAEQANQLASSVYVEWAEEIANEARILANARQFEDAIAKAQQAAELNPSEARVLAERVKRYEAMQERAAIESQVTLDQIDPTGDERDRQITINLERGRRLYNRGRYLAAREEFEQVLILDPFNMDATSGLFNINKKLKTFAEARRAVTEMERIAENAWKWNEPITPIGDEAIAGDGTVVVPKEEDETARIQNKLDNIVIPRIDFEEATIHQVIRFLRDKSRELDPEGRGVSIVFQRAPGEAEAPAPDPGPEADLGMPGFDFGEGDDWGAAPEAPRAPGAMETPAQAPGGTVTIAATDIPLGDAIRFVCESAGLRYRVTQYAVLIGVQLHTEMEVRVFDVPQGMFGLVQTREAESILDGGWAGAAAAGPADEEMGASPDMRAYLTQLGIEFPPNSAARLIRNRTRLWARNTPDSLRLIERFLRENTPDEHQITIEAKFVEISQNDLESLGFEWLINNGDGLSINPNTGSYDWTDGGKWNYGGWGKSALLKQDPNSSWPFNSALTGALRYATFDPTFFSGNDSILSLQSVLGSMEFTTVIHALNRADSTDILSSPKVTAKSDETAILRMVTERYFPESWTEPEIESGGTESNSTYKPSIPQFGPTRDIGVVLEATPKVDPKKEYLIDLLLRPQVYDFLGYDTDLNYEMIIDGIPMEGKAQMPIIAARTVETSVMVWDGETVVLGGMIQEHLSEYEDKVPLLGDIPLIGRLFQSRGKKSEKRNLLIFVTARLVDPAGRPKRTTHDLRGVVDFRR